jgi:hypothetical protein
MTSSYMKDKPFKIDKRQVYKAYKAVKSNQGAAGVDGQTLEQFETDWKRNLYKIWNRMSSGTYFPPPVRAVSIPKKSGGERILGNDHRVRKSSTQMSTCNGYVPSGHRVVLTTTGSDFSRSFIIGFGSSPSPCERVPC